MAVTEVVGVGLPQKALLETNTSYVYDYDDTLEWVSSTNFVKVLEYTFSEYVPKVTVRLKYTINLENTNYPADVEIRIYDMKTGTEQVVESFTTPNDTPTTHTHDIEVRGNQALRVYIRATRSGYDVGIDDKYLYAYSQTQKPVRRTA